MNRESPFDDSFTPGSRVRVKPEFDIPEMFRNGPSEGVVESVPGRDE